jgi:hypothetical protein
MPSQQPPLQVCPPAQLPEHWCEVVSQARPVAQSLELLQPQIPPRQALPVELPVQSAHEAPEAPHTALLVPGAHTPLLQQAP